jgi:DNA primase
MPIGWDDLDQDVRFDYFNVRNVPAKLRKRKDPWADFSGLAQRITPQMMRQLGMKIPR